MRGEREEKKKITLFESAGQLTQVKKFNCSHSGGNFDFKYDNDYNVSVWAAATAI